MAENLSARWKQPVVVDPHLFKAAAWNPTQDFVVAAALGHTSTVLVVPEYVPANNLRELVALVKSKPEAMTAGMVFGSTAQLNFESLKRAAGLQMVMAPFNGAPPITLALLNGSVQMALLQPGNVLPHIQSKRLKAIAVASSKRIELMPEVPTVSEAGHPEAGLMAWYGFTLPRGTPASVVNEINAAVNEALGVPKVREDLAKLGIELGPKMSVAEVNAMLKSDADSYSSVIKTLGVTAQ
jgi:tripartite-type tricarboxylate transporter receptor subunit TctC